MKRRRKRRKDWPDTRRGERGVQTRRRRCWLEIEIAIAIEIVAVVAVVIKAVVVVVVEVAVKVAVRRQSSRNRMTRQ